VCKEKEMTEAEKREKRAEALLEKCIKLLQDEGIPVSSRIQGVIINPGIRSRFGSCRKVTAGKNTDAGRNKDGGRGAAYRIELSSRLMEAADRDIETVLLHELLHTCPQCMNHGSLWKSHAARLNEKYGYQIKATSRYEDFGLNNPGSRETVKYRIVCTGCGLEMTRKRRCSLVENIDRYRCGKCGERLKIR